MGFFTLKRLHTNAQKTLEAKKPFNSLYGIFHVETPDYVRGALYANKYSFNSLYGIFHVETDIDFLSFLNFQPSALPS